MEKENQHRWTAVIISTLIAASGIVVLIVDSVVKPFLGNNSDVKTIIIFVSVLSAFHSFFSFTVRAIFRRELINTNQNIDCLDKKIGILQSAIPYSRLDDIEDLHGSRKVNCEIWIIANMLQEAKNDDSLLFTIYRNITKNAVHYYYILPDSDLSRIEINSLQSRLTAIHKQKHANLSGKISFRFDSYLTNLIASSYYDTVLFIDCDDKGNPYVIGDSANCEGYYCFTKKSEKNEYYYEEIETDRVLSIRSKQLSIGNFTDLTI